MLRFILELLIFSAITVGSTIPLYLVTKKLRRRHNARKWAIAAAVVAFITAGLGWSSRDLTNACMQERNEGCVDIGGVGTQVILIGGFVAWALLSAYLRYNDY